jgi:hypothetical protein
MNDAEWRELPSLLCVAKAQADGWEIESDTGDSDGWCAWNGLSWSQYWKFRGRPRQPAMKKVKLEAWLSEYELRWLNVEAGNKPAPLWIRVPSEDKTVEVPV